MSAQEVFEKERKHVGPGWQPLLDEAYAVLSQDPDHEVLQIKEKFGGLRFYVITSSKEARDAIDAAEAKSMTTCEECGKTGSSRNVRSRLRKEGSGGWIRVLCDEDLEKALDLADERWKDMYPDASAD